MAGLEYAEKVSRFSFRAVRLIMAVFIAVAVGVPAATWDPHTSAHLTATVDVEGHHHHDENGRVVADHGHGDAEDERDAGHEHGPLPQLIADGATFPSMAFAVPLEASQALVMTKRTMPPGQPLDPDRRPPRTV